MRKYVVIDANSSYFDENLQEFDYSRGFVVEAADQTTACELAKEEGFDGLLFAAVAINQAQSNGAC